MTKKSTKEKDAIDQIVCNSLRVPKKIVRISRER